MDNQSSENKTEETVVNPIKDERDLGDKTIDAVEKVIETEDHSKEFTGEEQKKYKTSSMICYLPIVPLYFIITGKYKTSNYLRFHVIQGFNATLAWVIVFFLTGLLKTVFRTDSLIVIHTVPGWVRLISYLLYGICFAFTFIGLINTANDLSKELPVIGKIRIIK